MNNNTEKIGLLLSGFLLGGLIGGVLTALFTPYKGEKLRREIKNKKDDIIEDFIETFKVSREKAEELYNEALEKSEGLIEKAKSYVSN